MIFTAELEKDCINQYVKIRLDHLKSTDSTLQSVLNKMNEADSTLKSVLNKMNEADSEYNKQATLLLETFLIEQCHEWFNLPSDMHWQQVKETIMPFVMSQATGLSIDWNDVSKVLSHAKNSQKAIILGYLMSFDILNDVDYMPTLNTIMNSDADADLKSHLIGMATLMRPTDGLKPIYNDFIKQGNYITFPLMCAAISVKEWVEKQDLKLALEQTSTYNSIPDDDSDYTHELLQEIYRDFYHDMSISPYFL